MLRALPFILLMLGVIGLGWQLTHAKQTVEPAKSQSLPPIELPLYQEARTVNSPATGYRLINLFASWCPPCIAEFPLLEQLRQDGIEVIGIAWKDKEAPIDRLFAKHKSPFTTVYLDSEGAYGIGLGIRGLPESFLIDPNGVIIAHYPGILVADELADIRAKVTAQ